MTKIILFLAAILSLAFAFTPRNDNAEMEFEKFIKPIINAKCTACHAYMPGLNYADYELAIANKSKIKFRVFTMKNMPPPSAPQLTPAEASALSSWVSK